MHLKCITALIMKWQWGDNEVVILCIQPAVLHCEAVWTKLQQHDRSPKEMQQQVSPELQDLRVLQWHLQVHYGGGYPTSKSVVWICLTPWPATDGGGGLTTVIVRCVCCVTETFKEYNMKLLFQAIFINCILPHLCTGVFLQRTVILKICV